MCKTLVYNSSRVEYYSRFKTKFKLENYLLGLNAIHRNYICKARTSNIRFQTETKNILWNELDVQIML